MESFSFKEFAKALKSTKEEGLSFKDKQETWDTAADVKAITDALQNTTVVHYLQLEGNTLGVDAAAAIGKALERHPEFRKAFWRNMFTRRLKHEIPQALQSLGNGLMLARAQLTVLDLSDNALGPNGMKGLEALLPSAVCFTLQELHLNNCGLGIGGGRMLSKALLECHANSVKAGQTLQLKVFVAGRNRLENEGAIAISKIFSTIKTLEHIAMPQNSIYHVGIAALCAGFKANPNLRILNLNDNTVTPTGAEELAEVFAVCPSLENLNFGDCLLRTNGAYYFAEALADSHSNLEVVDLGFNEIGSDGGLVLVSAMLNKSKLRELVLDGNHFGREGCEKIRETMSSAVCPDALQSLDEDESEGENDDDGDGEEDDGEIYDEVDTSVEYEADIAQNSNESTDDADEDSEPTTYVSSNQHNVTNESNQSNANDNANNADEKSAAEIFCLGLEPITLEKFNALPDSKYDALKEIIDAFKDDNDTFLIVLIFTSLKCAFLSDVSTEAMSCAIKLFDFVFDHAVKTKQERRIVNYYLMQLGLLRTEAKFKPTYNTKACRAALHKFIKEQKIESQHIKVVLEVFLDQFDN